jgi:RNA polymerase sigma-70 factor, ECF subfamily
VAQENTDYPNIADEVDSLAHVGAGSIRIKKFRNTYDAHGGAIYNYLLWMTKDAETSRDILQTVFIRLWEAKSLPENEDALRRWLFTTARNAFFDSYRSHCRFSRLREHYNREYFQAPPEAPEGQFWNMLSECSDSERSILYLHLKEGYSYKEIGVILNLGESNVRVKTCRAIKRLRELYLRGKRNES